MSTSERLSIEITSVLLLALIVLFANDSVPAIVAKFASLNTELNCAIVPVSKALPESDKSKVIVLVCVSIDLLVTVCVASFNTTTSEVKFVPLPSNV